MRVSAELGQILLWETEQESTSSKENGFWNDWDGGGSMVGPGLEDDRGSRIASARDKEYDDHNSHDFIVQGLPRRPLYRELSARLERWRRRVDKNGSFDPSKELMIPAEALGFHELEPYEALLPPPPPGDPKDIGNWMKLAGDEGILRLLGMRSTVGGLSDESEEKRLMLVPPSLHKLLEAANKPHSPKDPLTVAARARAKHAHRKESEELSFFGIVRGNAIRQNQDTNRLLKRILDDAVWINCHSFGGLDENSVVVELRVASGYGARWRRDMVVEEEANLPNEPTKLQFRGFLEPQMEDGHEKRWRH
ncbi:MAG: hypothetical protein SGILL_006468 [Bacillariaceae sp.]